MKAKMSSIGLRHRLAVGDALAVGDLRCRHIQEGQGLCWARVSLPHSSVAVAMNVRVIV